MPGYSLIILLLLFSLVAQNAAISNLSLNFFKAGLCALSQIIPGPITPRRILLIMLSSFILFGLIIYSILCFFSIQCIQPERSTSGFIISKLNFYKCLFSNSET